jgi:outer membrane lipopolysaccharide assembly protein LptE/RlpB
MLVERRAVVMSREFAVDERDVLGKSHEAEVLRDALLRDMVSALVRYTVATTP